MSWLSDGIAFVWYAAVLVGVGAIGATRVFDPASGPDVPRWRDASLHLARLTAPLLLIALVARLLMQTWLAFGGDRPMSLDLVVIIMRETYWGSGWTWQFVVGLAFWTTLLPRFSRIRALPVIAGLCVGASVPLTGHAAGVESGQALVVTAHAVHVLAAGLWLGTLAVLLRVTGRTDMTPVASRTALAVAIDRFSPQAVVAVALLACSGVAAAWQHIEGIGSLLSPYGFVLTAKVVAFGAAGLCGAYNWKVVRPMLATHPDGPDQLRSMGRLELVFGLVALTLTSALTAMDPPGH